MLGRSTPKTYPPRWSSALKRVQAGDDEPGSGDDQPCGDHYISDEMQCHQDGGGMTQNAPDSNWEVPVGDAEFSSYKQKVARKPQGQGGPVGLTASDLTAALTKGRYAILSAGKNPNNAEDMQLSDEQIDQRSGALQQDLVQAGYMFTPAEGRYGGESEGSFLVMAHETETQDVVALGKKYNQDSVIVADKGQQQMIFTTGENAGQAIVGEGFEALPEDSPEYTEIQTEDGQMVKFSLNFDWDHFRKAVARLLAGISLI
jgi:hypothetical protein